MYLKSAVFAALASIAIAQDAPTLTDALSTTDDLSSLNELITNNTDVAQALAGLTNFTILAPNNAAVANFTSGNNDSLADPAFISSTLLYHVLSGTYTNFTETVFVPTALAPGDYANVTGGQVVEARVEDGSVSFISGFALGSSTVGDPVTVQGGVVYIIDTVLTLPATIDSTGTELGLSSAVGAIVNASLAETLNSASDITVFVPNNAAFQAIGSALGNISSEDLATVLQYHVIDGQVLYSTDLSNTTVASLQGADLTITVVNTTTILVNGAQVVTPNVLIANGVVHVIDEVLNPENPTATSDEPNFPGATSGADQPYTGQAPPSSRTSVGGGGEATSTSAPGAAWRVKPTGVGAALLAGVIMAL